MTQSHTHKEDEALQVVTDAEVEAAYKTLCNVIHIDYRSATVHEVIRAALESFAANRPVVVPDARTFSALQSPGWATTRDWDRGWDACRATYFAVKGLVAAPQAAVDAEPDKAPRMNIFSQRGTQVVFDAGGGYPAEIEHAKKALTVGVIYTVERTEVGGCSSSVFLKGIDRGWNTIMFATKAGGAS